MTALDRWGMDAGTHNAKQARSQKASLSPTSHWHFTLYHLHTVPLSLSLHPALKFPGGEGGEGGEAPMAEEAP